LKDHFTIKKKALWTSAGGSKVPYFRLNKKLKKTGTWWADRVRMPGQGQKQDTEKNTRKRVTHCERDIRRQPS